MRHHGCKVVFRPLAVKKMALSDNSDSTLAPHRCGLNTCVCHADTGGSFGSCETGSSGWQAIGPDAPGEDWAAKVRHMRAVKLQTEMFLLQLHMSSARSSAQEAATSLR